MKVFLRLARRERNEGCVQKDVYCRLLLQAMAITLTAGCRARGAVVRVAARDRRSRNGGPVASTLASRPVACYEDIAGCIRVSGLPNGVGSDHCAPEGERLESRRGPSPDPSRGSGPTREHSRQSGRAVAQERWPAAKMSL